MTTVHVLLPDGVDDPARPSGGNVYDRRICDGLAATGWDVREHVVPGAWPRPRDGELSALAARLAGLPDGAVVLIDGLIASASAAAAVVAPESGRLRVVVLVHMPLPDAVPAEDDERAVLSRARMVVTTSAWARGWLLDHYWLTPGRVRVVAPGVDPADPAPGSAGGGCLLCVAAVVPHKGQDLLLDALAGLAERSWRCTFVGSLAADPPFVDRLRRQAAGAGIAERLRFTGPLGGDDLRREYRSADVLVLPSRTEAYGLVVTEALAAGLPVIATAVGGIPEAVGRTPAGPPGLLVPAGDAGALGAALSCWLTDAALRRRLRRAAGERRAALRGWEVTTEGIASVLRAVGGEPAQPDARVPR